jgi:hypothetical protein
VNKPVSLFIEVQIDTDVERIDERRFTKEIYKADLVVLNDSRMMRSLMAPRLVRFGVRSLKLSNVGQSLDG